METHNSFNEQFEFSGKAKTYSLIAIVIGIVAIAFGLLTGAVERTFANLLLMGYYFTCVCIAGVFFCALQYAAQAGGLPLYCAYHRHLLKYCLLLRLY